MAASDKIPLRTKASYGLGAAAFGIKDQGFGVLLMLYYNQVIGLPASWVGAAIMIAMIVDAIADPLIGHWSDNFRSRLGRRHPFMYAAALPVAISYFLLWSPPQGAQELQFAYLAFTAIAVRVSISFFEIPNTALTTEFTTDYDDRTSLATWRAMFFAVGTVAMAILTFKYLLAGSDHKVGQLDPSGYIRYSQIAAVAMFVCILLSTWGTHSRIPLLKVDPDIERVTLRGFVQGLGTILFDRTYASLLLCAFFFAIVGGMNTTMHTYLSTYFWKIGSDQLGTISASSILAMVLAPAVAQLARPFGKKEVASVLYLVALAALTVPVALGLLGFIARDLGAIMPWLIAQNVIMVTCVITALILITSMVADTGEHFRLKTGKRVEGLMFAALIMINKAVSGMGIFLAGLALHAVRFPEKATPETIDPAVVEHLGWIYVFSMAILCVAAVVALMFYPITREVHQRMLRELEARGAA